MKRFGLLIVLGTLLVMQYGCGHRRTCCRCRTGCYTPAYIGHGQPDQATRPEPVIAEPTVAEPTAAEEEDYDVAFQPDDLELNQPVLPRDYY